MLKDFDAEMRKRKVHFVVVIGQKPGTTLGDPDLTYVVGGSLARQAVYFKKLGCDPLLLVSNLDVGTAKKLGRVKRIQTFTDWGLERLAVKHGGLDKAFPHFLATILRKERITGKVVLYGRNDLAFGINLADRLRKLGVLVTGEISPTVIEIARETKSSEEIQELRRVGAKTARVVREVLEALRNLRRKRGHLFLGRRRATIGLLKSMISSKLAREDLIAPEDTIFAMGASAADPHNMGVPIQEIKQGRLIVFDIFPQARSSYWFDLTRTFVVGRADSKARRLYETVYDAQDVSLDFLREGITGAEAMSKACNVIERRGYPTIRSIYQGKSKNISSGFNHSLGHGVGLTIGERPYLSFLNNEPLRSGQVVTVEPGVYLPSYGGVRIEDTVKITSKGVEVLANVEKELELS